MASAKRHDNPKRRLSAREKAIVHNLGQLAGWMRHWRMGKPLTGSNRHTSYSIPYSDSFHIIALSVIDCDHAEARMHDEVATNLGIALSATLPQSLLIGLTRLMGSTLDLVYMLDRLKERGRPASEDDGLSGSPVETLQAEPEVL